MEALLKWGDVVRLTGLSESTIRRLIKSGDFPAPARLSANRIGWRSTIIKTWMEGQHA